MWILKIIYWFAYLAIAMTIWPVVVPILLVLAVVRLFKTVGSERDFEQ